MTTVPLDAVVIGAGPAGSTAASLLAGWGHSVVLLQKPGSRPTNIAEALPPSVRNPLSKAGVLEAVDTGGFHRSAGNRVWWGSNQERVETYPAPAWGYHVRREAFDDLLRRIAAQGKVTLIESSFLRAEPKGDVTHVRHERGETAARFVLDASGRAGVLARQGFRISSAGIRSFALSALWHHPGWTESAAASYTRIENYRDGWVWSVPLEPDELYVSVMIDARDTGWRHEEGALAAYRAEIAKTEAFRYLLEPARCITPVCGADATPYHAARYADSGVLLLGDAGSFLDPIASFGVKKALTSAWLAAVALHTALTDSKSATIAMDYYNKRERQTWLDASRHAARYFAEAAARHPHPFWQKRAISPPEAAFYNPDELNRTLHRLRAAPRIHLRRASNIEPALRPAIAGNRIVLEASLTAPQLPPGLDYINGVELNLLIPLAENHSQIPDLYEAYNQASDPVDLPNFLGALCLLVTNGVLEDREGLMPTT